MVQEYAMPEPAPTGASTEATTLGKAVTRAAELLGLSQQSLATVLGVSRPTVTRLVHGRYALSRHRAHEWEMATLFVRLFRSIDALIGHGETARTWLGGPNTDLGARPVDLILSAEGLVRVLHYLDAHRGRI
jgi:transcriptional regulator with XRE-family HTH domain